MARPGNDSKCMGQVKREGICTTGTGQAQRALRDNVPAWGRKWHVPGSHETHTTGLVAWRREGRGEGVG